MTIDSEHHVTLSELISRERLSPYMVAKPGPLRGAIELYDWNSRITGAFFELIGNVEVVVRNSMHRELSNLARARGVGPWYDQATWFQPRGAESIEVARRQIVRNRKAETAGRVVAELNFGFWRFLLSSHYEQGLWRTGLYRSFPHGDGRRKTAERAMTSAHKLRNRLAHHEPIFRRNHAADEQLLFDLAGWVSPDARTWLEHQSRVGHVLGEHP